MAEERREQEAKPKPDPGSSFDSALEGLAEGPQATEAETAAGGEPASDASHPTLAPLRDRFGDAVLRHEVMAGDEHVVFVRAERCYDVLAWLKDEPDQRYDLLKDITGVDYGGDRPIQVVYELWSIPHRRQLRVKAELPLERLEIRSVVPLWATANWLERETYDMFGVQFDGHPDLRRILMPEHYAEGHPLRKDFPLRGRFTRAEQTRRALSQDLADHYIPDELKFAEAAKQHAGAAGKPSARPGAGGGAAGAERTPDAGDEEGARP